MLNCVHVIFFGVSVLVATATAAAAATGVRIISGRA